MPQLLIDGGDLIRRAAVLSRDAHRTHSRSMRHVDAIGHFIGSAIRLRLWAPGGAHRAGRPDRHIGRQLAGRSPISTLFHTNSRADDCRRRPRWPPISSYESCSPRKTAHSPAGQFSSATISRRLCCIFVSIIFRHHHFYGAHLPPACKRESSSFHDYFHSRVTPALASIYIDSQYGALVYCLHCAPSQRVAHALSR